MNEIGVIILCAISLFLGLAVGFILGGKIMLQEAFLRLVWFGIVSPDDAMDIAKKLASKPTPGNKADNVPLTFEGLDRLRQGKPF